MIASLHRLVEPIGLKKEGFDIVVEVSDGETNRNVQISKTLSSDLIGMDVRSYSKVISRVRALDSCAIENQFTQW